MIEAISDVVLHLHFPLELIPLHSFLSNCTLFAFDMKDVVCTQGKTLYYFTPDTASKVVF